jgi:hypothetical protein
MQCDVKGCAGKERDLRVVASGSYTEASGTLTTALTPVETAAGARSTREIHEEVEIARTDTFRLYFTK